MFLLALCVPVLAGGTFTVTEAQYIVISGNTSDTLGREMITPDSIRIVVSDSAGTELFDAWFESADDQCALNGDIITFFDQWEDINGAASTGVFSIVATIASDADNDIDLFSNQNYVVIGVDEKVEDTYNEIGYILDTLQLQDDWVATEATAAKALDSLADILDSLESHDDWIATEVTAAKALDSLADILDSLESHDDWIATAAELAKVIDSLADILDSLESHDGWIAKEATVQIIDDSIDVYDTRFDSLLAAASDAKLEKVWHDIDTTNIDTSEIGEWFSTGISASLSDANMGAIADSVWDKIYADMVAQAGGAGDSLWAILNDLLDTLQSYDDWVATEVTATKALDSLADILDTLESHDDWVATEATAGKALDSLADILDTLESHDNWIAAATNLTKAIDSINALLDTLQLWDTRIDSIEAALADASIGDKVWTDEGTRTITAGVLTASEWEKVWHDIDTTNIDTSEIGEWFTTGISASLSDANIGQIADSVDSILSDAHGADSWLTGGGGSGSHTIIMYALDKNETDVAVQDVKITILNLSGEAVIAGIYTDAYGKYQIALDPADGYSAILRRTGYIWPSFSFDVSDDDDSLPVPGYKIALQVSPDPDLCRVQGYVFIPTGGTSEKIKVTFTISGTEAVHNSCDATALIAKSVTAWTSTHNDSLGFFYADLVPSGCLLKANGDSLQYKITQELGGVTGKEGLYWIPQEESYEVVW